MSEENQLKLSCSSEFLRPQLSIINHEIEYSSSENQIFNVFCDIMSHAMEKYFTNTLHTDLIDGVCDTTLKIIMKNGFILKEYNRDYNVWSEIVFAGNITHNGMLRLERDQDWAFHQIDMN